MRTSSRRRSMAAFKGRPNTASAGAWRPRRRVRQRRGTRRTTARRRCPLASARAGAVRGRESGEHHQRSEVRRHAEAELDQAVDEDRARPPASPQRSSEPSPKAARHSGSSNPGGRRRRAARSLGSAPGARVRCARHARRRARTNATRGRRDHRRPPARGSRCGRDPRCRPRPAAPGGAEGVQPRAEAGAEERMVAHDARPLGGDREAAREAHVDDVARRGSSSLGCRPEPTTMPTLASRSRRERQPAASAACCDRLATARRSPPCRRPRRRARPAARRVPPREPRREVRDLMTSAPAAADERRPEPALVRDQRRRPTRAARARPCRARGRRRGEATPQAGAERDR